MAGLIRAYDWAATPLGPIESWRDRLRSVVEMMLIDPRPSSLAVGEARTFLFNDAAARLYGSCAPGLLGQPLPKAFPSYPTVADLYDRAFAGEASEVRALRLAVTEGGEESFDATLLPVGDGMGGVLAVLVTAVEVSTKLRAESSLRESEARFRTLTEAAPALIWWNDGEGGNIYVNQHFIDYTGLPPEEIAGHAWQTLVHPEDAGAYIAGYLAAVRGRRGWQDRSRIRRHDGTWRFFENHARPIFGPQEAYLGHIGVSLDITGSMAAEEAQRQGEARQMFLLRLSDALRAEPDYDAVATRAIRMLADHMGLDRCYITFYRPEDDEAVFPYQVGNDTVPPLPAKVRLSDFPEAYEQVLHKTFVVDDDFERRDMSEAERANSEALGMRAMLASTVRRGEGNPLASLMAVSSRPRRWTPGEIALIEDVAERTWAALERTRAEAELRDSEMRFRALLTAGSYMIYRMSPDWTEMAELRGNGVLTDTQEPFSAWVDRYIFPEDLPLIQARIKEAIRTRSLFELEHRVRRADGSPGWVLSRAVPILGQDGEIIEWFGTGIDVTTRYETEQHLREAEERYRTDLERQVAERTAELRDSRDLLQATMDSSIDMIQVFKAVRDMQGEIVDFRWVLNNHTSESRYGKIEGESLLERNPGVVGVGIFDAFKRVTETGVPEQAERHYVHEQFNGWFLQSVVKLGDGVATTTKEITDWKKAQAEVLRLRDEVAQARLRESQNALQESEARFRQFGEASADVLWIRDCESLAFEYVSPAFEKLYGIKVRDVLQENHFRRWLEMILPEDRHMVLEAIGRVRGGEQIVHNFRILRGDGQIRWVRNTDFPLLDNEGKVQRIGGIAHDATEEVELQDRLQVLVAELQHRSRNLVSVVKGLTEKTLATSDTLERFRERFRPRLDALARINGLLSRLEEGDRITFDQLLEEELAAHGVLNGESNGTAVHLHGPRGIRLRSATVQTFALALHELTTNALKYGALSQPEGRLDVTWCLIPGNGTERRLRVDWREIGVVVDRPDGTETNHDAPPRRHGYGRELIERALPYQLKAQTTYELTPKGVRCTVIVPVSSTLEVAFSSQEDPDA